LDSRLSIVWVFAAFLSVNLCAASWPEEARRAIQQQFNQQQAQSLIKAPFANAATLQGALKREWKSLWIPDQGKVLLESPEFETGALEVRFVSPLSLRAEQKMEWVVVLPGLFGEIDDPIALTLVDRLVRKGYTVLAISNSWSPHYRQARPLHVPGFLEFEARTVLGFIREAKQKLQRGPVSAIHLLGVSYGGMLATVATALDQASDAPLLSGATLAFSPPLDLLDSMEQMDRGLQSIQEKSECSWIEIAQLSVALFFNSPGWSRTGLQGCADRIIYWDFMGKLGFMVGSMREVNQKAPVQISPTFRGYIRRIPSEMSPFQLPRDGARLEFWWNQMSDRSALRIYLTQDDFIYSRSDRNFGLFRSLERQQQVLISPVGGHFGYSEEPFFSQLLDWGLQ